MVGPANNNPTFESIIVDVEYTDEVVNETESESNPVDQVNLPPNQNPEQVRVQEIPPATQLQLQTFYNFVAYSAAIAITAVALSALVARVYQEQRIRNRFALPNILQHLRNIVLVNQVQVGNIQRIRNVIDLLNQVQPVNQLMQRAMQNFRRLEHQEDVEAQLLLRIEERIEAHGRIRAGFQRHQNMRNAAIAHMLGHAANDVTAAPDVESDGELDP